MDETRKTLIYVAIAVVTALLAVIASPGRMRPEAFTDQGEPFFPEFTDPNAAVSLEVIDYDEETGQAVPFKVTNHNGVWSIPSHYDYPADGARRLATTAAGIIQLRRDEFRTDNVNEYEACGVIDPLDETGALSGRGERVTVKGPNEAVLADLIIGKPVPGRPGFRFVRVPSERRVYAAKVDLEISTRFADWIDTDLLKVNRRDIDRIIIDNYAVNERTLMVDPKERTDLKRDGTTWTAARLKGSQMVDSTAVKNLLTAIDELAIVGVRPKPKSLAEQLADTSGQLALTQAEVLEMQQRGFYLSRDGAVLANEGEVHVYTTSGVIYQLRFGEVTYAGEDDGANDGSSGRKTENRFVFVTARFDEKRFPEPARPADTSFIGKADSLLTDADKKNKERYEKWSRWRDKVAKGRELVQKANRRFAPWFYLISADSFEKVRVPRSDLIVKKT